MTIREQIIKIVNNSTGIKAIELITKLDDNFIGTPFNPALLDQLAEEGEIVEIEYCVPQMENRIKSIYFPKGTRFAIIGGR